MSDFSITDFTVISDWETLSHDLGSLLNRWLSQDPEIDRDAGIPFKGTILKISLHCQLDRIPIIKEVERFSITSLDEGKYIGRCFGVEKYILVTCNSDSVISLSTARLILSSLVMSRIKFPMFVEYGDGNILGIETEGQILVKRNFCLNCTNVDRGSEDLENTLFQTFVLNYFHKSSSKELDCSYSITVHKDMKHLELDIGPLSLRWGCRQSLKSFELQCIFPRIEPGLIFASLLPSAEDAPIWMLSVHRHPPHKHTALCELIKTLVRMIHLSKQTQQTVSDLIHDRTKIHHLIRQTDSRNFSDYIPLLLGEDGIARNLAYCWLLIMGKDVSSSGKISQSMITNLGSFWGEIVIILREYWDTLEMIPMVDETPNHKATILEQKLSMINYCIKRELELCKVPGYKPIARHQISDALDSLAIKHNEELGHNRRIAIEQLKSTGKQLLNRIIKKEDNIEKDCEDEFFDVFDGDEDFQETAELMLKDLNVEGEIKLQADIREGNKKFVEDGEYWIPYTQEPGILIEDFVSHHDYPSNKDLKCSHLISDMQAFKAANPNCSFMMFIKWHSPRDIVSGDLSKRMSTPGNLWLQLWDACQPIPLIRQKLIFDHRNEVEKALFWFENVELKDFLEHNIFPLALEVVQKFFCRLTSDNEIIEIPKVINEDSLLTFYEDLVALENRLTFKSNLTDLLPGVPIGLNDQPTLIASEDHRNQILQTIDIKNLMPIKELVMERVGAGSGCEKLYLRLIDNLLEIATAELR